MSGGVLRFRVDVRRILIFPDVVKVRINPQLIERSAQESSRGHPAVDIHLRLGKQKDRLAGGSEVIAGVGGVFEVCDRKLARAVKLPERVPDFLNFTHVHRGVADAQFDTHNARIGASAVQRFGDFGDGQSAAAEELRKRVTGRLLRNVAREAESQHALRGDSVRGKDGRDHHNLNHQQHPD